MNGEFRTPALLVSVVNVPEAQAALLGGADIIDIKNPAEGVLGAPEPQTVSDICTFLKGKRLTSVALGEFPGKPAAAALAALGAGYFQPDFLKIAFLPTSGPDEIVYTLGKIKKGLTHLPQEAPVLVAVMYADLLPAAPWGLEEFAVLAKEGRAGGCLIDTWEKKGKSLGDFLPGETLQRFVESCHHEKLFCGLAGSLQRDVLELLLALGPDLLGVRSAAAGGDRLRGEVTEERVRRLAEIFVKARVNESQTRNGPGGAEKGP